MAAKKKAKKKKPAKKVAKKTAKKRAAKKKAVAKKSTAKKKTAKKKATKKKASKAVSRKKTPAKKTISQRASTSKKQPRGSRTEVQPFKPYKAARNEEHMNATQSAHFGEILGEWKRLLMEEVDRTLHLMKDDAANFSDPNDRATQEEEFALELRTRDRERKLIRKIDEAVLRLETDDFGYCEVCGVEIGFKRLEARPTATLCIDCKTLDEIKEKQFG